MNELDVHLNQLALAWSEQLKLPVAVSGSRQNGEGEVNYT
jgi:hypothetical protein